MAEMVNQKRKLTNWKNEPTVEDLKHDYNGALEHRREFLANIKRWEMIKDVKGIYKPAKVQGRSAFQPKVARQHLEWRYPSLSEPFLDVNNLFTITPRTFEDGKSAKQNEIVINYQFDNLINKVEFIDEFVRRNVDQGICIVKTFWERKTTIEKELVPIFGYMEVTDPNMLQQLQQYAQMKVMNYNAFLNLSEELQESVNETLASQSPVIAIKIREEEQDVENIVKNQPCLEIIDPHNFLIDPSCGSDYTKANFFIRSFETSKAELLADGKYKLDDIEFGNLNIMTDTEHKASTPDTFNFKPNDPRRKVIAYEYWGYYDINGDGIVVPILATWINNIMIRMEKSPYPGDGLPFVISKYSPLFGSVYGESDIELLEDPQKVIGAFTRANMDLLGKSANSQHGIAKGFLDPHNKKLYLDGKDYEYNPNMLPERAIYQHKFPELSQSSLIMLQQQKQDAESLTGIKSFNEGLNGNQFGSLAAAVKGTINATSKRESSILRRLIYAIVHIGRKVCIMNAAFLSQEETIRLTNKEFEIVRRKDLKGNFDIKVDITLPELNEKKASDFAFMLQTVGPNGGMELTKLILSEIAYLKNMPELQEKILQINTEPSPQQKMLDELAIEKAKLENDKLRSEIKVNEAKALEHEAKGQGKIIDNTNEMAGVKHSRELEKSKAQAKGNQDLEITKALLNPESKESNVETAIGYNRLRQQEEKLDE